MSRLTVALVLFVVLGIAAAFPNLNQESKLHRLRRALKQFKSKSFNLFDPSKENTLSVRDELEGLLNMLKREEEKPENAQTETAGSTDQGQVQGDQEKEGQGKGGQGKSGQGQGGQSKNGQEQGDQGKGGDGKGEQGQGDDSDSKSDEEEHKAGCERSEMEDIMMYLEDLELHDPFKELIDQTLVGVELAMTNVNRCTQKPVFDVADAVEELGKQMEVAYSSGMEEFGKEIEALWEIYGYYAVIGHQAAVESDTWTPFCSKAAEFVGLQIHYLSTASIYFKLDMEGLLPFELE